MDFIFYYLFFVIPASMMSFAMWLIMKKTKVEGKFLQFFLVSVIAAFSIAPLVNLIPFFKEFISFAILFLLLYKWKDIKFWPEVKLWPDSLLVIISGWVAYFATNYLFFIVMKLFK